MIITFLARLVDSSGQPAPGVGVALTQKPSSGPKPSARRILGTTVSDSNGGVSIPFERPDPDQYTFALEVSTIKDPFALPDLGKQSGAIFGPHTLIVPRASTQVRRVTPSRTLFASDADLVKAWKQEPALFSRPAAAIAPNPCNPATPRDVPARVFYFTQVLVFAPTSTGGGGLGTAGTATHVVVHPAGSETLQPAVIDTGQPRPALSLTGTTTAGFLNAPPLTTPRFGALFEYRQEWWDCGQTLGNLLYSVPLAPCEETKIATVDWRRRDTATQHTALDEQHMQDTTVSRDQNVDETVRMLSDKQVSSTTGGGGIGISIGPFSGGYSGTASNMTDAVNASTSAARKVDDRTRQLSNTVRHTRSFAVAEVTQEEEATVRTRVIRNHNHCHTVTFQYYEVLQVYLTATRVNRIRPTLLLPFAPLTFDADTARKYSYLLRRALLDPSLDGVLADLVTPAPPPPPVSSQAGATAGPPAAAATGTVTGLRLYANLTKSGGQSITTVYDLVLQINDSDVMLTWVGYDGNTERVSATATPPSGLSASEIERVGARLLRSSQQSEINIDDLRLEMQIDGGQWTELWYASTLTLTKGRRVSQRLGGSGATVGSAAHTSTRGLNALIAHLNANAVYYSAEIIAAGDAGQRYLGLASIGVADVVENVVVGKVGNYLAFPVATLDFLPEGLRGQVDAAALESPGEVAERLITLPTPGVFAESQLGNCSACEKIDDSVFWNWQTSPCPDEAPDITPEMLASRYQNPSTLIQVAKSDLQPSQVQMPTLPEPMIKIGDATLASLVKDLSPQDAASVLSFIGGLAKISSDHSLEVFKEIWRAYTGKFGGPGSGDKDKKEEPAGGPAGEGDATPGLTDGGALA